MMRPAYRTPITERKNFFTSRWFVPVFFAVVAVIGINSVRTYYHNYQIEQEIRRLEEEARRLEAKKLQTMEILKYVQSSAFVEEHARTELNLVKPGEKMAFLDKNVGLEANGQNADNVVQEINSSNPKKWWAFFFGSAQHP